ncbi:Alpha/beta hydrolase family protein [Planctopirus ephydatiae]|uniref:Alpha/beta hydrolase family protein n=2 Tax=Planctopirus ephydatiae TaxID=2528019 RepID=A0A518GNM0_9PLAN|nr:Alpha/beta hydrolase family protein [Planctopirus ephydatiae]
MLTNLAAGHPHDRVGDALHGQLWFLHISLRTCMRSLLSLAMLLAGNILYAEDLSKPGRYRVQTELDQWTDPGRNNRVIPLKIYAPANSKGRLPVVLFSHGGGGSREGNPLLGDHLASHGFVCIHLQHEGTDDRASRRSPRSIRDAANDPKVCADRFRDVAFAVQQVEKNELSQVLRGRLDPERIGVSGHSLGGITTQVIAGQDVKGYGQQFCLPKLKGAVILSPSLPRPGFGDSATAFKDMKMPMLSITGTADTPPDKSFPAKERRVPFDRTSNVEQWLLVLDGATHFTFSGNLERPRIAALLPGMEADPKLVENHDKVKAVTLAFWRWTLLDDPIAKDQLTTVLPKIVQSNGELEYKPAVQQHAK